MSGVMLHTSFETLIAERIQGRRPENIVLSDVEISICGYLDVVWRRLMDAERDIVIFKEERRLAKERIMRLELRIERLERERV